ncbi:hemolysin family protein [Marinicella litoralis]|uniref:CBS domain containing-hemolysin-like protein n=1 Tax=Marinicella litoralis TaxID=644220 RepID=A0A4R6XWL9_9GAMM|nr:hemolysin family protein [Marinicella litoralis]TDR22547.1 CBS domain containing-hemolysin-like protein [Marinicella litoralis]
MILLLLYVFGALFFSFLCSIAEAVLLSITPSYIENLKSTEPEKAQRIKRLRFAEIDRSLAAILTLNTIAHTVGAIVAGAKATHVFGDAWIGLFSAVITVLILFFSEIIPKTIGAVYWKSLASPIAYLVQFLIKILYPIIWLSEQVTRLISNKKSHHDFSRDEFVAMAGLGLRTGHIEEHESRIIDNLFTFNVIYAKDIMTPRTVMVCFPGHIDVETAFETLIESTFSRIPIYSDDMDDISSFVLKSDILMAQAKGENAPLIELQRELLTVIESTSLPTLLEMLLNQRQHIALVVDEYGHTAGLVTLEDVVETLLGLEIMDEVDQVQDMQKHARKKWRQRAIAKGLVVDEDT